MRTVDESTGTGHPARRRTRRTAAVPPEPGSPRSPCPTRRPGPARTARPARAATAVPASASTGIAELLRGPVRPARVLMSVPAAVYLHGAGDRGGDVVGVLTSDAARLPLGCVLFRPSNGRPLVALPSGAPAEVGGGRIVVGDLAVSAAAWWNPRPKLPSLRPALLPEGVRQLRNALYGEGVPHSAFTLPGLPTGPGGPLAALRGAVRRADLDAALRTATRLIGLGPGLTPAGDDVMAGHDRRAGPARATRRPSGSPPAVYCAGRRPHDRALPGAAAARRLRPGQRRVRRRAARAGRRAAARPGGRRRCWRPARPAAGRWRWGCARRSTWSTGPPAHRCTLGALGALGGARVSRPGQREQRAQAVPLRDLAAVGAGRAPGRRPRPAQRAGDVRGLRAAVLLRCTPCRPGAARTGRPAPQVGAGRRRRRVGRRTAAPPQLSV